MDHSTATRPSRNAEPVPTPQEDPDADGILAAEDLCPTTRETFDGVDDGDGCPDGESLVDLDLAGGWVKLRAQPAFSGDRNLHIGLPATVLDHLAALLRATPTLHVEIRSHEHATEDHYGMKPTQRRADNVRDYLIAQGVEASRVRAVGYGDSQPFVPVDAPQARAHNTRIEVRILEP